MWLDVVSGKLGTCHLFCSQQHSDSVGVVHVLPASESFAVQRRVARYLTVSENQP